ncbi:hypothetical protein CRN15_20105 [Raoultella planticola]|nr:hypothetical protein CRT62_14730 [Raoultella planticola]ATM16999.1 hypothetical protein CRN15_20105 [Raoultella planticola]OAZ83801.1 hypothetical protein AYO05_15240 [Raoultella planticola]OAZ85176.1 hypothetical protein AYO04_16635 [Raoultella planticola]OZP70494.1 hypothetical protein CIG23_28500 [Raoultella planticola]
MTLHWFIHHAINNARFWYGADELTEVKVRCERKADIASKALLTLSGHAFIFKLGPAFQIIAIFL